MTGTTNTDLREPVILSLLGVTRNTDNYGVRVLLSSAVDLLSSSYPDANIVLLDYGRESKIWREQTPAGAKTVRLINLRFSWRILLPNNIFRLLFSVLLSRMLPGVVRTRLWPRNPWLHDVLSASVHFSLAGGDSFSDIYGLRRFVYVSLPQILVLLMQRPLVLLPQTYGPFGGFLSRWIARWILRRAHLVCSRDAEGVKTVRDLFREEAPEVVVVPDLGFSMAAESLDEQSRNAVSMLRKNAPLIGLNISSLLWMGGYTGDNMFGLKESFPSLIRSLVEYLVKELGARVMLVPHVCGGESSQEDERRICRIFQAEQQCRFPKDIVYLDHTLNHRQMKGLIGQCDVFIGARMHACIAAASQEVPTVCLAYSAKFAGVMKWIHSGVRVMDLRRVGSADVADVCGDVFRNREKLRNELHQAVPPLIDAIRENISGVLSI